MRKFFRHLRAQRNPYQPLVEVRISSENLFYNLRQYQEMIPSRRFAPVLKSNAYGHGLLHAARLLSSEGGIPFFVVDSFFEALMVRNEKIKTPLLIVGYSSLENILQSRLSDVSFTITSIEQLRTLSARLLRPRSFHLKWNTGMHRQGIDPGAWEEAVTLLRKNPNIQVSGMCSHLGDADGLEPFLTQQQIRLWNEIARRARKEFPIIQYIHVEATAGSAYAADIDATVARLGIGLYGFGPKASRLRPVLSLHACIGSIGDASKGDRIGYNGTYVASRDMRFATVPVGYFEGVDRRLSSKGMMLVRGIECPIIGRVSMNITTLDVTAIGDCQLGEPVVALSATKNDPNTVESWAHICETIPHDILVHIPSHLRRVVV
jgi:alanine racemase